MIPQIVDLLIELATTPNLAVSEDLFQKYQITDEYAKAALLRGDAQALKEILDPQQVTLDISNHTTIFTIAGTFQAETFTSQDGTSTLFVCKSQDEYNCEIGDPHKKYKARLKGATFEIIP